MSEVYKSNNSLVWHELTLRHAWNTSRWTGLIHRTQQMRSEWQQLNCKIKILLHLYTIFEACYLMQVSTSECLRCSKWSSEQVWQLWTRDLLTLYHSRTRSLWRLMRWLNDCNVRQQTISETVELCEIPPLDNLKCMAPGMLHCDQTHLIKCLKPQTGSPCVMRGLLPRRIYLYILFHSTHSRLIKLLTQTEQKW